MIKEINNIKFTYKGIQEIDEKLQEKINNNWNELLKKSDLFHEGKILIVTDIKNNEYSCERNLKREFKEELGINIEDPKFTIKLKYLKYPSETEDKTAYPIGTIFEVKTEYTKDEIEEQFKTNTHDNETSRLIFFNKGNYKEIYNYKQKKQYIPELWERIFS